METLLIAESIAQRMLPRLAEQYVAEGVELRGCDRTREIVSTIKPAVEEDWKTEYVGPVLSIRVVAGLDEAIAHINKYGSQHTNSIVTKDYQSGQRFLREVDSSSVMINASPRFSDGLEYGLGDDTIGMLNRTC